MKVCSRSGCFQWTIDPDEELCTYDAKVRDGLIVPDLQIYGRRWSQPRLRQAPHRTVNPSDVVSDEQLELANLLRGMGASEVVVARAIAREPEKMPSMRKGAKRGTGVKRGRLVEA